MQGSRRVWVVCELEGIVIAMCEARRGPPHFHVLCGDRRATVAIESSVVVRGSLPRREAARVFAWATIHARALEANWERARRGEKPRAIRAD